MARTKKIKPVTVSHYLVTMQGMSDVFFTEFSGIKEKTSTIEVPDGQRRRKYKIRGMKTLEPCTLAVQYDPDVHAPLISRYEELRNTGEEFTVTVTPTNDTDEVEARGKSFILNGCYVTGFEIGEVDRSSETISMIRLDFEFDTYTTQ